MAHIYTCKYVVEFGMRDLQTKGCLFLLHTTNIAYMNEWTSVCVPVYIMVA